MPAAQALGAVVLHFANQRTLAGSESVQRLKVAPRQLAFGSGDGVAVGIFVGLAQMSGDGLLQPGRDGMFERLGLGIDLAPIQAKHARQKEFHQAMPADDPARLGHALLG